MSRFTNDDTIASCSIPEDDWVSFSLTHVKYPRGDRIGHLLAFISLTPFAIFVSYVTLIIFKREIDTVLFLLGQLANELLNIILKNAIRQERPMAKLALKHSPKTFGMPSQHSQFQSYFTVYAILFIIYKLKYKPLYWKNLLITGLLILLLAVIYSRVYLLYHTLLQVVIGLLVGISWATLYFFFVYKIFEPRFFSVILSLPISRFIGLTRFMPARFPGRKYN